MKNNIVSDFIAAFNNLPLQQLARPPLTSGDMKMPRPLSDEERRDLRKLYRVVEAFRTVDKEMPVQQMATLLIVALHEGLSLKEISDRLATASSTASRNVAALSKVHRLGKRGHDLISSKEDPMERRRKVHTLTAKGRLFILRILGAEDA